MTEPRPSLDALRIERQPERTAARPRWPLVLLAVLIVAAGALFVWWRAAVGRAPEVTVVEVREEGAGAPAVLDASGYVTARRQATVSSKVTGKIIEVLVEEGMAVAEGQVLARLDASTAEAGLRLTEAGLEASRRALAETEVRLAKARLDRERAERLVEQAVAPQDQLDTARAEVDALAARLAVAREQLEVAAREVALQRVALEDTVIRAPFSGVAISKNAQPGEMISPISAGGGFTRTGVCTLVDMSSLEIEVDVNEAYIQRVFAGQRVEAVLDAYPDWTIPARVITSIPAADRQTATVKVRIGFDALDPRILPDMGVSVAFLEQGAAGAETGAELGAAPPSRRLLPRAAVRAAGGEDIVWVVADGRVERRAVSLGAASGDQVQVLAGVTPGEQVVMTGPDDLVDGQEVRVAAPAPGS